jgi:asparagine synthase (glutamine-hydrolysing)
LNKGLHAAAQRAGVRVLLDGFGGDSVVSHGTDYLTELIDQQRWLELGQEIEALARRTGISPAQYLEGYALPYLATLARRGSLARFARTVAQISRRYGLSRRDLWLKYGLRPLVPAPALRIWRALRRRSPAEADASALLSSDLRRHTHVEAQVRRSEAEQQRVSMSVREEQRRELESSIFQLVLEENDRVAAACSIEARYPFFDKRLVEFCLALPATQKLRDGWGRFVLRNAMSGILSSAVQWRTDKADLSPNFTRGLLGTDRALLEDILLHEPATVRAYVDTDVLRETYRRYVTYKRPGDELLVWRVAMLELWLRHADRRHSRAAAVQSDQQNLATHTPEGMVSFIV